MKKIQMTCVALLIVCGLFLGFGAAPSLAAGPNPVVIFETNMGRFMVMLYPKETPVTVENFLRYVDEGFYDGTLFHRVVTDKDFDLISPSVRKPIPYNIIQGGGYEMGMRPKPTHPPIVNEAAKGMLNAKGTIAMARGNDPDSATAQFFINVQENKSFDFKETQDEYDEKKYNTRVGYCAFGKVIRGMDVVEKISEVQTSKLGMFENVPVTPVVIKKAYRPQ
jgi:peptidyl-prolyl cis-trans isomerase A (cyclophilin A)/peptidyl-prolyl cis-trans isomerase B (cyclophilin B)